MEQPFFSICIPTYKQPELLRILLRSIDNQTFRNFEVIISDDSNDNSVQLVASEVWTFNLDYYKNTESLGSPENWNKSIERATGKWIKIMHHDDFFANEDSLKIMYDSISENNKYDFFFCSTIIYNAKTKEKHFYVPNEKYINSLNALPTNLFQANVIGGPSATIFRRELSVKFDKSLIWLVDIEFYTQVILKNKIFRIQEKLIVTSAELETQLTTSLQDNGNIEIFEYFYCYEKLLPIINEQNKKIFRIVLMNLIDKYEIKSVKEITDVYRNSKINSLVRYYAETKSKFIKKLILKFNNIF
jgi:glycosyltransferase involved in cell wall biosynthesis